MTPAQIEALRKTCCQVHWLTYPSALKQFIQRGPVNEQDIQRVYGIFGLPGQDQSYLCHMIFTHNGYVMATRFVANAAGDTIEVDQLFTASETKNFITFNSDHGVVVTYDIGRKMYCTADNIKWKYLRDRSEQWIQDIVAGRFRPEDSGPPKPLEEYIVDQVAEGVAIGLQRLNAAYAPFSLFVYRRNESPANAFEVVVHIHLDEQNSAALLLICGNQDGRLSTSKSETVHPTAAGEYVSTDTRRQLKVWEEGYFTVDGEIFDRDDDLSKRAYGASVEVLSKQLKLEN